MERIIGGKLLSPARRHDAVWHLVGLGYSQRLSCQIVGLSRSAYRRARTRESTPDKYADLREWMHEFARDHRRWGHRRAWRNALAEGYGVCRETFRRLWREEGLRVLPRKKRKRLSGHGQRDVPAGQYPNDVWALDFQFDSTWHGKMIKICNIIDEYTREHVAFAVDKKLDAGSVIELLDVACLERGGRPRVIRMDNGPEFIAHALEAWAAEDKTIQALIPPGQPWHNGFVESFHNRMRDELLEDNSIENLEHARLLVAQWSSRYNNFHPHSALGYLSPRKYAEQWKQENTVNA
ncbi:IS3 family transposase [Trueperella pecoris]|uniref:IS3 family transposase n=1 Tax=Trueperella pecoris TaxID=2733571 RepID=UPI00186B9F66|nr:IS3 family transposase [Trueperella pecoris]QOQ38025.1 IS3 family transposase [Trueperella pecoris]